MRQSHCVLVAECGDPQLRRIHYFLTYNFAIQQARNQLGVFFSKTEEAVAHRVRQAIIPSP